MAPRTFICGLIASCVAFAAAAAADRLVKIDTRPGVRVSYWWMERPDATDTLLLLPGGNGGIGMSAGVPTSENFLVRNRDRFTAAKFNVATAGRPSDQQDLSLAFRTSDRHVEDLQRIVARLKRDAGKPVWLVATSRGTTSAAAAAIALGGEIAGVVLLASITKTDLTGALQHMRLDEIRVPVLLMHHRRDACNASPPGPAQSLFDAFTQAPVKRFLMPTAGGPASGDACSARHWHGFAGMDETVVEEIADFVRNPKPEPP